MVILQRTIMAHMQEPGGSVCIKSKHATCECIWKWRRKSPEDPIFLIYFFCLFITSSSVSSNLYSPVILTRNKCSMWNGVFFFFFFLHHIKTNIMYVRKHSLCSGHGWVHICTEKKPNAKHSTDSRCADILNEA